MCLYLNRRAAYTRPFSCPPMNFSKSHGFFIILHKIKKRGKSCEVFCNFSSYHFLFSLHLYVYLIMTPQKGIFIFKASNNKDHKSHSQQRFQKKKKKEVFKLEDRRGHYDMDGFSYDGEAIYVSSSVPLKNPQTL